MESAWRTGQGQIDPQRWREVADKLAIQSRDAAAWRNQCLLYFQSFSRMPLP